MDAVDYCRPDVCPKTSATVRRVQAVVSPDTSHPRFSLLSVST